MKALVIFRKLKKPFIIFKITAFILFDVQLAFAPPVHITKFHPGINHHSSNSTTKIYTSHIKLMGIRFNKSSNPANKEN